MASNPSFESLKRLVETSKGPVKPSTYYRHAHPELFSDSTVRRKSQLTKSILSLHLTEITANKQEQAFEELCRSIAEREICPNLIPQTGPVGGGDSKVDAATYPVATQLSEYKCWRGAVKPSGEDWAFAFSAQKTWETKVKADVAKIISLPRDFKKIFFVTNQLVSDKKRAATEADLSRIAQRPVHIFDRNWIVTKVLTNGHEDLVVKCLGLDTSMKEEKQIGPNDLDRQNALDALLKKLSDPAITEKHDYAVALDYLEAAQLAAQLEHARSEIDGLFLQARRLALKTKDVGLIIRTHYQHAWRSYFYFDDAEATFETLILIRSKMSETELADDLSCFSNLLNVLSGAGKLGQIKDKATEINSLIADLKNRLTALSIDSTRPNNALQAETLLLLWDIHESQYSSETAAGVFKKLRKCLKKSQGLGTYPFLQFQEVFEFYGEIFCDLPGYAELHKDLCSVLTHRFGETESGRAQLHFGLQLMEKKQFGPALQQLTEARIKLSKSETLGDSINACLAAAAVYHDADLFWASRMEMLGAANLVLRSWTNVYDNPNKAAYIVMRMSWLELELGRIGPFLAWRGFMNGLVRVLNERGLDTEGYEKELERQDGCLGCLLLRGEDDEIKELDELKDVFRCLGLSVALFALIYRNDEIATLAELTGMTQDEVLKTVSWMRAQPAYSQVPNSLCDETRSVCNLRTNVLGIEFSVRCRNKIGPVLFTENLLGVIESALCLARWENLALIISDLKLFIDETSTGESPPSLQFRKTNHFEEQKLFFKEGMVEWMRANRGELQKFFYGFLLEMLVAGTIDPKEDILAEINFLDSEKSFERALNLSPTSVVIIDLMGPNEYDLNQWIKRAATSEIQ